MSFTLFAAALAALILLVRPTPVLAPSNRFINVLSVVFTPTTGSAITIKGVQSAAIAENASDFSEGGDGDLINSSAGVNGLDPMVSVEFLNMMAMQSVPAGEYGTLVLTFGDSKNQGATGGGAMIFTISNCYFLPQAFTMQFRQLGRFTGVFKTYAPDGVTNPIASAAA